MRGEPVTDTLPELTLLVHDYQEELKPSTSVDDLLELGGGDEPRQPDRAHRAAHHAKAHAEGEGMGMVPHGTISTISPSPDTSSTRNATGDGWRMVSARPLRS